VSCLCNTIQAADPTRHFKGCPERVERVSTDRCIHDSPYMGENACPICSRAYAVGVDSCGPLQREVLVLREQLRLALHREKLLNDNLGSVHARCTKLIEELRATKDALQAHALRNIVLKGWKCPNPICGVFNSEEKERRDHCRACDTGRPKDQNRIYFPCESEDCVGAGRVGHCYCESCIGAKAEGTRTEEGGNS